MIFNGWSGFQYLLITKTVHKVVQKWNLISDNRSILFKLLRPLTISFVAIVESAFNVFHQIVCN